MHQLTRRSPVKQFLAQKSVTEMEHSPCSPDVVLNDFCLFPKIKSALKGRIFQDIEDIQKMWRHWKQFNNRSSKKMFPTVAALLG
jgi:hypothetical protein